MEKDKFQMVASAEWTPSTAALEYLQITETGGNQWYAARRLELSLDDWLGILAFYPDRRNAIALNRTTPVSVLELMLLDDDPDIRDLVLGRGRFPASGVESVRNDPDVNVRAHVARHSLTSIESKLLLLIDPEEWTRRNAWNSIRQILEKGEKVTSRTIESCEG